MLGGLGKRRKVIRLEYSILRDVEKEKALEGVVAIDPRSTRC